MKQLKNDGQDIADKGRRTFLRTGLALSALPLVAAVHSAIAAVGMPAADAALQSAVFDARFPHGREYGRLMQRRGVPVQSLDGDVTGLWFEQLDPLWRVHQVPVAGLTTARALFCLEQMAGNHGMRVVHRRALDVPGGGEVLVSWIIGPPRTS